MSRRRRADKREVIPDPKFGDLVLTKFMNSIMKEGKRSAAERIVYGALDHGILIASARRRDDPADSERLAAVESHLDRNLIGGAADAPRPHLERRHHVAQRLVE